MLSELLTYANGQLGITLEYAQLLRDPACIRVRKKEIRFAEKKQNEYRKPVTHPILAGSHSRDGSYTLNGYHASVTQSSFTPYKGTTRTGPAATTRRKVPVTRDERRHLSRKLPLYGHEVTE